MQRMTELLISTGVPGTHRTAPSHPVMSVVVDIRCIEWCHARERSASTDAIGVKLLSPQGDVRDIGLWAPGPLRHRTRASGPYNPNICSIDVEKHRFVTGPILSLGRLQTASPLSADPTKDVDRSKSAFRMLRLRLLGRYSGVHSQGAARKRQVERRANSGTCQMIRLTVPY